MDNHLEDQSSEKQTNSSKYRIAVVVISCSLLLLTASIFIFMRSLNTNIVPDNNHSKPAPAPVPGSNEHKSINVFFLAKNGKNDTHLFCINEDSKTAKQVTPDRQDGSNLAILLKDVSPDGEYILFDMWKRMGDIPTATLMKTDGTEMKELIKNRALFFSPDGKTIATYDEQGMNMNLIDLLSGTIKFTWNCTERLTSLHFKKFSHDGKRIIFQDKAGNLHSVNAETGQDSTPLNLSGVLSPDDSKFYFSKNGGNFWVSNTDGSNESILQKEGETFRYINWSSDSKSVIIYLEKDYKYSIVKRPIDPPGPDKELIFIHISGPLIC